MLTENSVGSQVELLRIILDLDALSQHSRRSLPVLVEMDIHYRVLKLMYGLTTQGFCLRERQINFPLLYGI